MHKRLAFTLVELLVVVAIIAILMSLLLPSLGRAKDLTKQTVCAVNTRSLGQAENLFAQDHQNFVQPVSNDFPAGAWVSAADPGHTRWAYWPGNQSANDGSGCAKDWASALMPYVGGYSETMSVSFVGNQFNQSKIFICPSDINQVSTPDGLPLGYRIYNNVLNGAGPYYAVSYGINADITALTQTSGAAGTIGFGRFGGYPGNPTDAMNVTGGPPSQGVGWGGPMGAKLQLVARPSETLLFADCGTRPWNGYMTAPLDYNDSLYYTTNFSNFRDLGSIYNPSNNIYWIAPRIPTDRHRQNINVAFCDGHSETVTPNNFGRVLISPW
jgi:prepilin-type N-terminal cleavage/methylation domain-containing protein/prepilin-type processing-associated H-X9-DG protein